MKSRNVLVVLSSTILLLGMYIVPQGIYTKQGYVIEDLFNLATGKAPEAGARATTEAENKKGEELRPVKRLAHYGYFDPNTGEIGMDMKAIEAAFPEEARTLSRELLWQFVYAHEEFHSMVEKMWGPNEIRFASTSEASLKIEEELADIFANKSIGRDLSDNDQEKLDNFMAMAKAQGKSTAEMENFIESAISEEAVDIEAANIIDVEIDRVTETCRLGLAEANLTGTFAKLRKDGISESAILTGLSLTNDGNPNFRAYENYEIISLAGTVVLEMTKDKSKMEELYSTMKTAQRQIFGIVATDEKQIDNILIAFRNAGIPLDTFIGEKLAFRVALNDPGVIRVLEALFEQQKGNILGCTLDRIDKKVDIQRVRQV